MRQPGAVVEPAGLFEIVQRPAAIDLLAITVLVLGLAEMGMEAHVEPFRQRGGRLHQRRGHREWRTRSQRDLHHGVLAALVEFRHHALAVGQDRVLILHHAVRRQPAILHRAVHRTPRQQHPQANFARDADLDVNGLFEPGREHVMMVRGGGAARQQQFGHRHGDAELERFGRQPCPHRIQRLEPGKQLAIQRCRQRPRQRLVEMVVGVDQPRQHDMFGGIEHRDVGRYRRGPRRHQLDDATAADDEAAFGALGENGQRVFDPGRRHVGSSPSLRLGNLAILGLAKNNRQTYSQRIID